MNPRGEQRWPTGICSPNCLQMVGARAWSEYLYAGSRAASAANGSRA